ncbi:unnamed protein product [Microthlaspi erraticum]|uniref:F-box domain-containing protein n=1 Tax=Microthlaspi erraticum TaxID=1685480 RepID=A0A6D2J7L8_9BRAS|nr:unnamed protein product [Microthlaspi erraticum]
MDGSGTDNNEDRLSSFPDYEDRLSSLPDSLLDEILLNLSTKNVVRTSVLSRRWGNLWRCVPGLDLSCDDFREYNTFVSFVDRFLGFNSELCIENFKLKQQLDSAHFTRWINDVVKRRVKHLSVISYRWRINEVHIPSTVYTCESLVTLELRYVILPDPKSVFLPCLKDISLVRVKFANDLAFERLISGSPLLDRFISSDDQCMWQCKVFTLRYLKLSDYDTTCVPCFIVKDLGSLVKVDMDIVFKLGYGRSFDPNDLPKINMIRDFFKGISTAKDMVISSRTLEVIYESYLRCQPLPLFLNLSSMRVTDYKWQMLPAFLESFPNLKSLVVKSSGDVEKKEGISTLSGRPCFLSSLEYVEIERSLAGLVTYFLENSTLCLDDSRKEGEPVILKRPLIPLQDSLPREIDSVLG